MYTIIRSFIPLCGALLISLSSCTLTFNENEIPQLPNLVGSAEQQAFQKTFMSSFDIFNGTYSASSRALTPFQNRPQEAGVQARATVPLFGADSITLPIGVSTVTGSRADYPEPNQNSTWVISVYPGLSNVYKVEVTSLFPSYDPRSKQVETYLIKDLAPLGSWTTADLVVDDSGAQNDGYRIYNRLNFRDGSFQDEVIVQVRKPTTVGNMQAGYEAWGADLNELDYPEIFKPVVGPLYPAPGGAMYSSVVFYKRSFSDAPSYSFWSGKRAQTIIGMRYYTEHLAAGNTQLVSDMIVFEKAITELSTTGGNYTSAKSALFLPDLSNNPSPTLLAQSVLRQKITYGWNDASQTVVYSGATRDTRMKTVCVDISETSDFYITRINDEAGQLLESDSTLFIPSGDATEVEASDDASHVDTKETNQTAQSGSLSPVTIITNDTSGDLGTLYVSLNTGTASKAIIEANDIAGDLTGITDVKSFDGQQGYLAAGAPAAFYEEGTIEAWVYVDKHMDTAGIVHSGIESDFSDEVWSLQFSGKNGQLMFAVVAQGPYTYDYVLSKTKLNTKRWYYVVSTWSIAGNYMRLYINGVLDKSATFSNINDSLDFADPSPVVVGSQFYNAEKVLSGYYGFDGKINGVLISQTAKDTTTLLNFYNANKDKTANW